MGGSIFYWALTNQGERVEIPLRRRSVIPTFTVPYMQVQQGEKEEEEKGGI